MLGKHRVDFQNQLRRCCLPSVGRSIFSRYGNPLAGLNGVNGVDVLEIGGDDKGKG
jgi:hypothetical protein